MDIIVMPLVILLPLIAVSISWSILEKNKIDNQIIKCLVWMVPFIIGMLISIYVLVNKLLKSINDEPVELFKSIIYMMFFIIFWLSGTNINFEKTIKNIFKLSIKFLLFKIIISSCILWIFVFITYNKFIAIFNQNINIIINNYITYFLIYIIIVIFLNMFIKVLKTYNFNKNIIKIIDCFDCIDFMFIIALNSLLLTLSNKETLIPILLFSTTITIYSDRQRIIKYYFGGDYEKK